MGVNGQAVGFGCQLGPIPAISHETAILCVFLWLGSLGRHPRVRGQQKQLHTSMEKVKQIAGD